MSDAEHSGRLVYDGDCSFCTRCAQWLTPRFRDASVCVAWQELPDLGSVGLTLAGVSEAAWWLADGAQPVAGESAIAAALRHSRAPWPLVGTFIRLPLIRRAAGRVYRWVAAHRYAMPGGTPACRLPASPAREDLSTSLAREDLPTSLAREDLPTSLAREGSA